MWWEESSVLPAKLIRCVTGYYSIYWYIYYIVYHTGLCLNKSGAQLCFLLMYIFVMIYLRCTTSTYTLCLLFLDDSQIQHRAMMQCGRLCDVPVLSIFSYTWCGKTYDVPVTNTYSLTLLISSNNLFSFVPSLFHTTCRASISYRGQCDSHCNSKSTFTKNWNIFISQCLLFTIKY